MCWGFPRRRPKFLSTPSARRATGLLLHGGCPLCNFYPRPPRGGRLKPVKLKGNTIEFLSTPSARRATGASVAFDQYEGISIHALREEGDDGRRRV